MVNKIKLGLFFRGKRNPFFFILLAVLPFIALAQEDLVKIEVSSNSEQSADSFTENDKISLDLRGVEITELFKILSRRGNLNIIPSAQVKGRVNIFLNDVSVEDAIEIILVSQNLAAEKKENILYIMTATEYQQTFGQKYYEKRELKIFKLVAADPQAVFNVFSQIKSDIGKIITDAGSATIIVIDIPGVIKDMESALVQLETLPVRETFRLSYAKAEGIQTEIASLLTPGISKVQVDIRTNQISISDLPDKMAVISEVVKAFDEPDKQVFIEVEIVQVTLSNQYEQGINWEKLFSDPALHGLKLAGSFYGQFPLETASTFVSAKQGYMSVGTLATDGYHGIVQFLETIGKTNILSRPRIAVLNDEEAKILIGTREAYTTGTLSQADSSTVTSENVEFVDVGIKLNVVPHITYDDFIVMKIKPEVSVVKEYLETSVLQSRIPIVETSEAETVIKVKNGTMIMIGGLIKKEKTDSQIGYPFLSNIPILKLFFSSRIKEVDKTELIIFIRPYIISGENVSLTEEESDSTRASFKREQKGFLR